MSVSLVPKLKFDEILDMIEFEDPGVFTPEASYPASLNIGTLVGAGSFKVAHHATLTAASQSRRALKDSVFDSNTGVVAKQPFLRQEGERKLFPPAKSIEVVQQEGHVIMMASALMELARDHVKRLEKEFKQAGLLQPDVFYAHAAVGVAHGTKGRGYLLEEYIDPSTYGPFIKYVSNDSSKVVVPESASDEEKDRAEYLSFIQHTQYVLTGRNAFVSDFQGMLFPAPLIACVSNRLLIDVGAGGLLTDPQIITNP